MKNPHIRGLGEVVLRVKNLGVIKEFYARVLGLELMKEFEASPSSELPTVMEATPRSWGCSRRASLCRSISQPERPLTLGRRHFITLPSRSIKPTMSRS